MEFHGILPSTIGIIESQTTTILGSEVSGLRGNDYSVQLGTLQVAKKRDCEAMGLR
jgi:hypothetical protein